MRNAYSQYGNQFRTLNYMGKEFMEFQLRTPPGDDTRTECGLLSKMEHSVPSRGNGTEKKNHMLCMCRK